MKCRYKTILLIAVWITAIAVIAFLLYLYVLHDDNGNPFAGRDHNRTTLALPLLLAFYLSIVTDGYLKKAVIIEDEYFHFSNFKLLQKRTPVNSVNIRYEDICSIEAKVLPIIGITKIIIKANHYPKKIVLSCLMQRHTELFETFYRKTIQFNPDAYIDKRISECFSR